MITSRAILFGFIGGCFYLIAVVNSLPPPFFALMWLTAGILVSCFGIALLSLYGLRASWQLETPGIAQTSRRVGMARVDDSEETGTASKAPRAEEDGAGAGLALEIGNAGTFNKSDIVIEVRLRHLKPEDEAAPAAPRRKFGRRAKRLAEEEFVVRRFLVEALPSRARLLTFLPLHDLERGRYTVAEVRAVGSDVLGLFRPRKKLAPSSAALDVATEEVAALEDEEAQVIVGPRLVRMGRRAVAPALGTGSRGSGRAALAGRSDEFGGTRPYVAGDDLRFVHWKSTARRGEMVVREWERAALRRSLVLWDGCAFAWPGSANATDSAASTWSGKNKRAAAPEGEMEQAWKRGVEWSLEIALSLSNALAANGEPCALWRLDNAPRLVEISGAPSLSRGAELLADARSQRTTPLPDALRGALASQRRESGGLGARAFLIAPTPSASLLAAARQLRGATVVLIDISLLQEARLQRSQHATWRKALREAEAQLRELGLRVVRLPLAQDELVEGEPDWDEWTRSALRALLDSRPNAEAPAASGAASAKAQEPAQVLAKPHAGASGR